MTHLAEWVCMKCKHYASHNKCVAFPDGIPDEISSGKNRHSEPVDGDDGIVFEEIEKDAPGYYRK